MPGFFFKNLSGNWYIALPYSFIFIILGEIFVAFRESLQVLISHQCCKRMDKMMTIYLRSFTSLILIAVMLHPAMSQARLSVHLTQPPMLEISSLPVITAFAGKTVTIGNNKMVSGGNGSYTFTWYPGEFLNNTLIPVPEATVFRTTTFTLVVTDGNGCTASAQQLVLVDEGTAMETIPPGNLIRIYPNPASGEVLIDYTEGLPVQNASYTLVDAKGSVVLEEREKPLISPHDTLKLAHLRPGMYTLIIRTKDYVIYKELIIY